MVHDGDFSRVALCAVRPCGLFHALYIDGVSGGACLASRDVHTLIVYSTASSFGELRTAGDIRRSMGSDTLVVVVRTRSHAVFPYGAECLVRLQLTLKVFFGVVVEQEG